MTWKKPVDLAKPNSLAEGLRLNVLPLPGGSVRGTCGTDKTFGLCVRHIPCMHAR